MEIGIKTQPLVLREIWEVGRYFELNTKTRCLSSVKIILPMTLTGDVY